MIQLVLPVLPPACALRVVVVRTARDLTVGKTAFTQISTTARSTSAELPLFFNPVQTITAMADPKSDVKIVKQFYLNSTQQTTNLIGVLPRSRLMVSRFLRTSLLMRHLHPMVVVWTTMFSSQVRRPSFQITQVLVSAKLSSTCTTKMHKWNVSFCFNGHDDFGGPKSTIVPTEKNIERTKFREIWCKLSTWCLL